MEVIFLSHSSKDKEFVELLASEIETELGSDYEVFASSRPNAIPSGVDWKPNVVANLEKATVLVLLITRPSENSAWVGFEFGYFWKKNKGKRIHALYHPTALVPSPLDTIQAKLVTDKYHLQAFFRAICTEFDQNFKARANLDAIVNKASEITVAPPERSLERFMQLVDNGTWNEYHIGETQAWICEEDVAYQIVIDPDAKKFTEKWTQGHADKYGSAKYRVDLKIFGITIRQLSFITLDGGRYMVPMTTTKVENGEVRHFWVRDSIEFRVGKIINHFYHVYSSIEALAEYSDITIV